jgi:nucleoside-diphosphate-sugar epimerase
MRVFLAGASGVIGIRLIPLLVADGHAVAGMTRTATKADGLARAGAVRTPRLSSARSSTPAA